MGWLSYHQERSGSDQDASGQRFDCDLFVQENKRQKNRDDDAQLVDRYNFRRGTGLQRPVIA